MAFSIQISEERFDFDECGEVAVKGKIEIGGFREELLISLEVWSAADYRRQWETGLRRIFASDRSCLVTSMRDLDVSDFVNCWLLYRVGDEIAFQNQVFVSTEVKTPISSETVYGMVPDRETKTVDGIDISEWRVRLRDIETFLQGSEELKGRLSGP